MQNLLSRSFSPGADAVTDLEMGAGTGAGANLDEFFESVELVKEDLKTIEKTLEILRAVHEESKTAHNAKAVKELRSRMDREVNRALKTAKGIKTRLESLDKGNEASRELPGCGAGSSADRTRSSVVGGLRRKLKEKMDEFQELRERINGEYKETVGRRYFTVTGENADEKTVDLLISTGESETFLQKAIQQQGRGQVLDTIAEIQERHDAVKDIERNLNELHQVFLDMSVLVNQQGDQLNDIGDHVSRARSYVERGNQQLTTARKHQKNTRKWTCFAIILLLIIILVVVLSLHPWK